MSGQIKARQLKEERLETGRPARGDAEAEATINRRLTERLMAHAMRDGAGVGSEAAMHRPGVIGQVLAIMAALVLLAIAWIHAALFERGRD